MPKISSSSKSSQYRDPRPNGQKNDELMMDLKTSWGQISFHRITEQQVLLCEFYNIRGGQHKNLGRFRSQISSHNFPARLHQY